MDAYTFVHTGASDVGFTVTKVETSTSARTGASGRSHRAAVLKELQLHPFNAHGRAQSPDSNSQSRGSRAPTPNVDQVDLENLNGSFSTCSDRHLTPPSAVPSKDVVKRKPQDGYLGMPQEKSSLRVVSLNLGGRNTNPLEFELKGDSSEPAVEAAAILRKAGKALMDAKEGPLHMPLVERRLIEEIVAEIYNKVESRYRTSVEKLLECETWAAVLRQVKEHQPQLFNALNLSTLTLKRPSVWEDPASCRDFASTKQYLDAWQEWYRGIDRTSQFWLEDAPRTAAKRNLDVATAFAGLLLFDVMCLSSACCAMSSGGPGDPAADEGREVPFKEIMRFASRLPASSIKARHNIAEALIHGVGAHALFAQEAREFASHPTMATAFWPPFCAQDGFTCIFLRKKSFVETYDISAAVCKLMEDAIPPKIKAESWKPWRTTAHRLAAVDCKCSALIGSFRVVFVSLHCSKSDSTAIFLETLRDVLAQYSADVHIVGMDSNCCGQEAAAFQRRLWSAGFEIGCQPRQDQVTVAKQRTFFQTQVKKAGETDISHKDYIVSWGSSRVHRGRTSYKPDLRTAYGVERETKRCVRLPTIRWPFDHCAVVTSFQPRQSFVKSVLVSRRALASLVASCLLLAFLLLPLASPRRESPYGPPGTWHRESWPGTKRAGICEASAPCESGWERVEDACYAKTTELSYKDAEGSCRKSNGTLVSIDSEAENSLVASVCPEGDFCWIGLRGATWTSGDPVTYTRLVEGSTLVPIFPQSRNRDDEVAVISSLPGEISGCHAHYLLVPRLEEPLLVGIALALTLSFVVLILPRPIGPKHGRLTTLYFVLSFSVNFSWWVLRVLGVCFVDDISQVRAVISAVQLLDTIARMLTNMLAYWIVLKRLSFLCPTYNHKSVFLSLLGCVVIWFLLMVLFVDVEQPISTTSWIVWLCLAMTLIVVVLYLVFCAIVGLELYQVWGFMKREESIGRSQEGGSGLSKGVRAARIHFISVSIAMGTGALAWTSKFVLVMGLLETVYPAWPRYLAFVTKVLDSVTNDLCTYLLAVLKIDDALARAKGINAEVSERASREVEQHALAVGLLKAAPTSQEQLCHLAELEEAARRALEKADNAPFLVLKSAVGVESARIHRLMECVRARAMTMPLRYQYLLDVPTLQGAPRQHVPAAFAGSERSAGDAAEYFDWLYAEADGAQQVFFHQVKQLLAKFNRTPWPTDLGLVREQFPWTIWASGPRLRLRHLQKAGTISPGDILILNRAETMLGDLVHWHPSNHCMVLEEGTSSVRIHCSGVESEEEVWPHELRRCTGGGVFIPGPKKIRARCLSKIAADYQGKEPWPAAASLLDICRCQILLDDPYAVAVIVAFIRKTMNVVRIKNRFSEDVLEPISPEELQAMFYTATDLSDVGSMTGSSAASSEKNQYRDIAINVVVPSPTGAPIVCEIQVTLSNLAILKHADTTLYTIRRMQSPEELRSCCVFSGAL